MAIFRVYTNSNPHPRLAFEYDPNKSASNEEKHGIDFEEAKQLWLDPYACEMKLETAGEQRYMLVAHYAGGYWSAVHTMRTDKIRIISVRRSSAEEMSEYDKAKNNI